MDPAQKACEATVVDVVNSGVATHVCPANCHTYTAYYNVIGTYIYSVYSSLCGSAEHAGKLPYHQGGAISISDLYGMGELNGGFTAGIQAGFQSKASSARQYGFSFDMKPREVGFWKGVWANYMGPSILIDALNLQQAAFNWRTNGCVSALGTLIRSNISKQPWNVLPYIRGVQGVGPANSSYNYGFMTMAYAAIFETDQSQASINYWLPLMDNGTLDALGIVNSFLSDTATVQAYCSRWSM